MVRWEQPQICAAHTGMRLERAHSSARSAPPMAGYGKNICAGVIRRCDETLSNAGRRGMPVHDLDGRAHIKSGGLHDGPVRCVHGYLSIIGEPLAVRLHGQSTISEERRKRYLAHMPERACLRAAGGTGRRPSSGAAVGELACHVRSGQVLPCRAPQSAAYNIRTFTTRPRTPVRPMSPQRAARSRRRTLVFS